MDFFTHQEAARTASRRLIGLLGLAVLLLVGIPLLIAEWYVVPQLAPDQAMHLRLVIGGGLLAMIGLGTLWKMWELRAGGPAVAEALGGREVCRPTDIPALEQLLNIVEEMAIASGVSVPPVYLLNEEGINAAAAGYGVHDAAILVSKGAIAHLTRDELQGVIAHEYSHILNGDMRLNTRIIALIHGILVIGLAGRLILESAGNTRVRVGRRDRDGGGLALVGLGSGLVVAGYGGWFCGRLIRAAVGRQREYLADASAVQFTRNPQGIGGALKKVAGLAMGGFITHPRAAEASHMFFANALTSMWWSALATHPPISERIRRIDPAWNGTLPEVVSWRPSRDQPAAPPATTAPAIPAAAAALAATVAMPLTAMPAAAPRVGTLVPEAVAWGRLLLARLPDALTAAASEAFTARAAVLLAAGAAPAYEERLRREDPTLAAVLARLRPVWEAIDRDAARLPLVQLSLPALRRLAVVQQAALLAHLDAVAGEELAGFAVARLVRVHLRRPVLAIQFHAIRPLLPDILRLLAALAHHGGGAAALRAGWQELGAPGAAPELPAPPTTAQLAESLDRLALANAAIKRRLVAALGRTVAADGQVVPREAELLRMICDVLGCPLPPFQGV